MRTSSANSIEQSTPESQMVSHIAAGLLRGPSRTSPSMLATREHSRRAVLHCGQGGDRRRSGAAFGARSETRDRRFGTR